MESQTYHYLNTPSETIGGNGDTGDIDVPEAGELAFDMTVSALDAGATLVVTFNRKGLDGNYYPLLTSANIVSTPTVITESFGVGAHVPHSFGDVVKVAWTITSSKHATFSLSLSGK